MATLDDIRAKIPSLQGLSDQMALRYLEQRYRVPAATIARNLGVNMPEPAAPPAPSRSLFAVANDTVISAANAAAGTVGAIGNFIAPGNRFSQGVDEFIKQGEMSQSDAVQQDRARFRERMAGAQGVGDELSAVGRYIADSPLQMLAEAAGSIAVPGAAMRVAGALGGGVKTGLGIGAAVGGAGAGGDAAGTAYELAKEAGATDEEATAAARSASVIPGIVGGVGGVVGAERLLAGARGFTGDAVSRALKTAGVEGAQEGIEEGITQYEGQRAAVPFDPTIDPMKGVAGAAAMGAALGGAAGGGVSLLSPAPAPDMPPPDKKAKADAALTALGSASTVDEAVALATKATDIPVLPTPYVRDPNSAKATKARNLETLAWVRGLDRPDHTAALGLMAVVNNPRTPDVLRRSASAQLDALERKARTIPTGEAAEVLPTGEVDEVQDIPTGEASEVLPETVQDGRFLNREGETPEQAIARQRFELQRKMGLRGAEVTELLPTGEATEVDHVPVPDVLEEIPAGDAAEVLPVGDAAEVLPTGDVIEEPDPLPTGEATDIEPDQADEALLLTSDGMPYGTLAGARVRAKREGLPPEAVVEVPGGWAVKKESDGERGQPDVAGTAGRPAAAGAGRAPDAVGSGVAVGRVAADAGGGQPASAAGVVGRGGQVRPAGDGGESDPALRVKALSAQWADAVARGDMAEAKRLNDAIVEARKPKEAAAKDEADDRIKRLSQAYRAKLNNPERVSDEFLTEKVSELVAMIDAKDADALIRRNLGSAEMNPGSRALFEAATGIKLPKRRRDTERAIDQWAGVDDDERARRNDSREAAFKLKSARGDVDSARRIAARVNVQQPGGETTPGDKWVDGLFSQGFTRIARRGPKTYLANETGAGWPLLDKSLSDYARKVSALAELDPSTLPKTEAAATRAETAAPVDTSAGRVQETARSEQVAAAPAPIDTSPEPVEKAAASEQVAEAPAPEPAAPSPQVSTRTDAPPPAPAPAPTNPPAPAAQTRPERLIELRKRQSVLKQLLECLG